MPTKKPRVRLTLEDHEHEALQRISKLTGRPTSSAFRDVATGLLSILPDMADALERAAQEKAKADDEARQFTDLLMRKITESGGISPEQAEEALQAATQFSEAMYRSHRLPGPGRTGRASASSAADADGKGPPPVL